MVHTRGWRITVVRVGLVQKRLGAVFAIPGDCDQTSDQFAPASPSLPDFSLGLTGCKVVWTPSTQDSTMSLRRVIHLSLWYIISPFILFAQTLTTHTGKCMNHESSKYHHKCRIGQGSSFLKKYEPGHVKEYISTGLIYGKQPWQLGCSL